jgi:hypothetical protein
LFPTPIVSPNLVAVALQRRNGLPLWLSTALETFYQSAVADMLHGLDHRPARGLALATGLDAGFHLARLELVALACTGHARLYARPARVDHQRALARDQVGRQIAESGAIDDQAQDLSVLLFPCGHLQLAEMERFVAGAFARLARLQAVFVDVAQVALLLGMRLQSGQGHDSRGPEHSQNLAAKHCVQSPKW